VVERERTGVARRAALRRRIRGGSIVKNSLYCGSLAGLLIIYHGFVRGVSAGFARGFSWSLLSRQLPHSVELVHDFLGVAFRRVTYSSKLDWFSAARATLTLQTSNAFTCGAPVPVFISSPTSCLRGHLTRPTKPLSNRRDETPTAKQSIAVVSGFRGGWRSFETTD
jgi:hypothetical protein